MKTTTSEKPPPSYGFSLLELLAVLAITGILFSLAGSSLYTRLQHVHSDQLQRHLYTGTYSARSTAIAERQITILCPLGETGCASDWSRGYMVFVDRDNNRALDANDRLVEVRRFKNRNRRVGWRASAGRNFLRYSPSGMSREFGRFTICDLRGDLQLAREIVVNRQGRLRRLRDRDSDGIVEDSGGNKPRC